LDVLKNKLAEKGYTLSPSLGFNNTYTLAVRTAWAKENNIRTFSDLKKIKILKAAFTPEFTSRAENWPSLKKFYGFNNFSIFEMGV
jgi:osmoprotectant transport system permease protein